MLTAQLASFRKSLAQYAPLCTVCPTTAPSFISRAALSTPNTSHKSGMQIHPQQCGNRCEISMTGQWKPQTELTWQLTDKLSTDASTRKLTTPNSYMIFSPPTIEYTGTTRHDTLNVHCVSIRWRSGSYSMMPKCRPREMWQSANASNPHQNPTARHFRMSEWWDLRLPFRDDQYREAPFRNVMD